MLYDSSAQHLITLFASVKDGGLARRDGSLGVFEGNTHAVPLNRGDKCGLFQRLIAHSHLCLKRPGWYRAIRIMHRANDKGRLIQGICWPHDQSILTRVDLEDMQRQRRGQTQPLALANSIVCQPTMAPQLLALLIVNWPWTRY